METLKLREDFIKLGQGPEGHRNGGKRRRSQACDPGWTGKGKRLLWRHKEARSW